MEKILVQSALKELKELHNKIKEAIKKIDPIAVIGKVDGTIKDKSKEEFSKTALADYENVINLINRRNSIKSAIVESNSKTIIKVGDKEYTVAQAIELNKSLISNDEDDYYYNSDSNVNFRESLLNKMKRSLKSAKEDMAHENRNINSDEMATTLLGNKPNMKDTNLNDFMNSYRENNEFALVDPLKLQDVIDKEEAEYEDFKMNIDEAIQYSNCTTFIEIP